MKERPRLVRELVEPGALMSGGLSAREGFVCRDEAILSAAISLRRIADALQPKTIQLKVDAFSLGIGEGSQ